MQWSEIRRAYPDQWLVIEALQAHTTLDSYRHLDSIAVIECCDDGRTAMQRYRHLHRQYPAREFYFVHTSREEPGIRERQWAGIRRSHARSGHPKIVPVSKPSLTRQRTIAP